MRTRKIILAASVILVAVVAIVWQKSPPRISPAKDRLVGKAAVVPAAFYLPFFVAKEEGFFEQEGLDVEIVVFNSNADMFTAFLKGDIDVTALGSAGVFPFEAANPGKIKFLYGQNNRSYSLVVKKGATIDSITKLRGTRIGTWPSPTSKTFLRLLFDKSGLADDDYEIVPLEFKSLNRALQRGEVDALFNTDLFTESGIQAGISQYLSRSPLPELLIDPTFNGGGLLRSDMLERDLDRAERYSRALRRAVDFIRHDERSARLTLMKYLPFEEEVVLNAPLDEFIQVEEIRVKEAQELAEMLVKAGLVKSKIDVELLIYRSPK